MSEFLTEKKLFQETFGGTTFNHFIEWFKKLKKLVKLKQKRQKVRNETCKLSKWIVDPESIKLQILNSGDEPIAMPVKHLVKGYKY